MRYALLIILLPVAMLAVSADTTQPWKPNPTFAAGLSLVIPGAGQIYNRSYLKAPIVMGIEGYAAWVAIDATGEMRDAEDVAERSSEASTEYQNARSRWENARDRRNIHLWLLAGFIFLSTIDAYVDAHLYPWTREMGTPIIPPESEVAIVPTCDPERGIGFNLVLRLKLP